jgi:hypothetical protein
MSLRREAPQRHGGGLDVDHDPAVAQPPPRRDRRGPGMPAQQRGLVEHSVQRLQQRGGGLVDREDAVVLDQRRPAGRVTVQAQAGTEHGTHADLHLVAGPASGPASAGEPATPGAGRVAVVHSPPRGGRPKAEADHPGPPPPLSCA